MFAAVVLMGVGACRAPLAHIRPGGLTVAFHKPRGLVTTHRDQLGRRTVYDALRVLSDKRLIRRIQPAGSPGLFDPRVGDNHHHAICRTCGKTTDVDCAVGEAPCLTAADSDYRIDEAEVIYWGICPGCLAESSRLGA